MHIQHFWESQVYQPLMLPIWMHLFWKEQQLFRALQEFKPRAVTHREQTCCVTHLGQMFEMETATRFRVHHQPTLHLDQLALEQPSKKLWIPPDWRKQYRYFTLVSFPDKSTVQKADQCCACSILPHPTQSLLLGELKLPWMFYGQGIDHVLCMQSQTDYLFAPIYLLRRTLASWAK